ncbi:hypothetical protein ACF09K_10650 [Streptomyces sp. NPDC014882]|uniref:hypothetical protein n=1 Tax=Streptomyces sp. NPDC014882 TaxID=3364927 RepID=UPI0036FCB5DD
MQRHSGGPPPGPRWLRPLGLGGAVVCVIALPLAMASAGPTGDGPRPAERRAAAPGADDHRVGRRPAGPGADAGALPAEPSRTPLLLGLGTAAAARCGPEVTSPEGVEAQTCVLARGGDTWARTYYRNTTGSALEAALSFLGPGGRTVQTRCALGADDEPGTCETPRGRSRGGPAEYTAVAEFARVAGAGPLLLRSGSNSGGGESS